MQSRPSTYLRKPQYAFVPPQGLNLHLFYLSWALTRHATQVGTVSLETQ